MASLIYLDTHVLVWLFGARTDLLPPEVRELIQENDLLISPGVSLELQYLYEGGRTGLPARDVVDTLAREIGLAICDLPFREVAACALEQSWTRNPFDRLIVSQAIVRGAPLVTRDRHLQAHYARAVWAPLDPASPQAAGAAPRRRPQKA